MGLIGAESDALSIPYLIVGGDNDPPVIQVLDKIPVFLAAGNPIHGVAFTIEENKFGQAIGHCFDLQNKTLLPDEVKVFPYGSYVSEHKVTTRALDTNSTCVDVKALETKLGVLQNFYAISRDMLEGDGLNGRIKGFRELAAPDKTIDLQGDELTLNALIDGHNRLSLGQGLCGYILGNGLALKAFMDAHFVRGFMPEFTHIEACCPDGTIRKVQVPKFMGFPFVRIDTWPVTAGDQGAAGGAGASRRMMGAGGIGSLLAQGSPVTTDLVFIAAGQSGVAFHVPSNIGEDLFEVRETQIPGKSHVQNAVYTTIALTVVSDGALVLLKNFSVPKMIPVEVCACPGFVFGAQLSFDSVSSVKVGRPGVKSTVRDGADTFTIRFVGELTADLTASGAGGLDTGGEAPNTWYAVHVIADSTGANPPAAMFSLSATSPTLPAGYDKFRRIGWVRNDGSSNIVEFDQLGEARYRETLYLTITSSRLVLADGAAIGTVTAIDCSSLVPPTATKANIFARQKGTPDLFLYKTTTGTVVQGLQAGQAAEFRFPLTDDQRMAYTNFGAGGSADVIVSGYWEEI
jgi:hypothetical protein